MMSNDVTRTKVSLTPTALDSLRAARHYSEDSTPKRARALQSYAYD